MSWEASSGRALTSHKQTKLGNASTSSNSSAKQSQRSTNIQRMMMMMMMIFPSPSEQHTNNPPILPCIVETQPWWRQFNNHVLLAPSICCFCSDFDNCQKSIITCKQTLELTVPTWKIREFQKTALDFPSATRHREVQELSVPQLSCRKNLLNEAITPTPESLNTELNPCKLPFLEGEMEKQRHSKGLSGHR